MSGFRCQKTKGRSQRTEAGEFGMRNAETKEYHHRGTESTEIIFFPWAGGDQGEGDIDGIQHLACKTTAPDPNGIRGSNQQL